MSADPCTYRPHDAVAEFTLRVALAPSKTALVVIDTRADHDSALEQFQRLCGRVASTNEVIDELSLAIIGDPLRTSPAAIEPAEADRVI